MTRLLNGSTTLVLRAASRVGRKQLSIAPSGPKPRPAGMNISVPTVSDAAAKLAVKEQGPIQLAWSAYCRSLNKNPLLTKATSAALIFFCSDSATQYIIRNDGSEGWDLFRWNGVRALSGASFGVVATGWLHYWWGFLEYAVGSRVPVAQYRLANTMIKVILDQGIGAPLYLYTYYTLTNFGQKLMQLSSTEEAWQAWSDVNNKASDMLLPTLMQHWKLWPAVHSFNFYFIPLHHRVLVQNSVLVGWSGYLSYLNNSDILMTPDEEIKVAIIRRDSNRKMEELEREAAKTRVDAKVQAASEL